MQWSDIIDIRWSDHKLQKACATDTAGQRRFGADQWKVLRRRIAALEFATSLAKLATMPGNCHPLRADRGGQYALDLRGAYRLVFVPDHDPIPNLPDGSVDEALVTKVLITEVVNYHGR